MRPSATAATRSSARPIRKSPRRPKAAWPDTAPASVDFAASLDPDARFGRRYRPPARRPVPIERNPFRRSRIKMPAPDRAQDRSDDERSFSAASKLDSLSERQKEEVESTSRPNAAL